MSNGDPQVIKASEIEGYEFGNAAAPEGFDPEAHGYSDPTPGWHTFEITDFGIRENKSWNGKDFGAWTGNQLEPRLAIPKGQPEAGASVLDFIPMPTQGRPMPKSLANRWANFLTAFGFRPPADSLVPKGFKLHSLIGARGQAEIELDEYEGKKKLRPKFFGYKSLGANGVDGKPANGGSGVKRAAASKPAEPEPLDLKNL